MMDDSWIAKRIAVSLLPIAPLVIMFYGLSADILVALFWAGLIQSFVSLFCIFVLMDVPRYPNLSRSFEVTVKTNNSRTLIPAVFTADECWFLELMAKEPDKPLTHEAWTGAGKPMSRKQFEDLTEKMIKAELAIWNDPLAHSQGRSYTEAGLDLFRKIRWGNPPPQAHA